MRKKIFIVLLVLISAIACVFGIAGCNNKPDSNGDNQDTNNEQGSDGHVHEYGSWTVTKEATCSEEGSHERTCTKCDYTQIETISKKGHTFNKDNICTVCEYELEYTTGLAYEEYTVRYNETYYIVTGMGTATDKDLVIPAYHAGKEVKKIAASAFSGKDALTSVYIANGIEQIGEKAFEYCTSIEKITLPESLNKLLSKYSNGTTGTFIGYYDNVGKSAFYGCQKLTDINLPDRGTIIGECAFEGTAYFKNVKNWDKGVLYIGNHLITTNENFTATSYTVSKDVVSIADKAFYGKSALKEFIISEAAYPRIGDNALKASGITKAEVSYYHGENQLKYLPASNITDLTVHGNIYE
ncbi:MAG: leucine-rich repeat domain-containing protein, partial [Clostridia bacterium]|nr:leucine-rich repeat domain-containing protein [Clostridia bacterium]